MKAADDQEVFIANIPGASDVQSSYVKGKEEVWVRLIEAEAAAAGITAQQLEPLFVPLLEGVEATSIKELDEEIDIRVQLKGVEAKSPDTLKSIKVVNPAGRLVPLGRIATLESGQGIAAYEHEDNERQVRLTAELNADVTSSSEATALIKEVLPKLKEKHPNIEYSFGGEERDTQESLASLKRAFLVAVLGIYLILVLIFGSYIRPFLVISVIPLGIVGVIWAFYLHGKPLTFLGDGGCRRLVRSDREQRNRLHRLCEPTKAGGEDRFKSILSAAKMRFRPIFLTTVTTSAGILPTAYGLGGLDPFVVPIALSLGYGV